MSDTIVLTIFGAVVLSVLVVDLALAQRRAHFPPMNEALLWTGIWVALAFLFGLFIHFTRGTTPSLEFATGYIVEQSLSIDNVFVFIVIFTFFAVPRESQHKILFWGVVSAIVFRAVFIVVGAALVARFHWVLYLLGAFLVGTAVKLAVQKDEVIHPERNPALRFVRKMFPVTADYQGQHFFVRQDRKLWATPLLIVLVTIETTDIAFATDSIPAIFAITRDTFIIFTSNIFAVLGLRSLYFVVAGFMTQFHLLKYGLSVVLAFIGVKMLIEPWLAIHISVSLIVIFSVVLLSVLLSVITRKPGAQAH